ncbi:MarR family transcriptional regulator [Streptacidiphilus pinicola]|uniref:MarR family transcriptional regulator n=1 Tax=Streptacidiphilus pinicola TaxID=2219663 RepID=A0A2X0IMR0_9ACTN|nr:MarR family transcriptional regulator [Streptacidiphilus pinicola]RAG85957.1 MarR family transcriptional regulator [Streptacidiphilus pinicola]
MADHVDRVVRQWAAERPDLDVSPMEVIGRLKRLSRLVDAELKRNFAAYDLDAASFDVLATLRRSGAPYRLTPTALMQSAMVTSGAITQRLDRLEARGLVTRSLSEVDGRSREVALTGAGHALIDRALPAHVDTERGLLAGLDPAETSALVETLRTLLASLGDSAADSEG